MLLSTALVLLFGSVLFVDIVGIFTGSSHFLHQHMS